MNEKDAPAVEREILMVEAEGPAFRDASSARDLIELAMNQGARVIAVPVERLNPEFLQLRSGIAGEVIQKVLNYKMKFAVVGDVSAYVAESDALRDFVIECERGTDIIFAPDMETLFARLRGQK